MSSTIALPRIRFRVRRRRPPSARELIHWLMVGATISQAAWFAVQLTLGVWFDGLMLLLCTAPALWILSRVRERLRYYERNGLSMPPPTWQDWMIPFSLWLVQIALWGLAI